MNVVAMLSAVAGPAANGSVQFLKEKQRSVEETYRNVGSKFARDSDTAGPINLLVSSVYYILQVGQSVSKRRKSCREKWSEREGMECFLLV